MKKLLVGLFMMFVCSIVFADTINLHWLNEDGTTYAQTTCESGGNLNIPSTTPTKRGYHFVGWETYTFLEYIESTGTQYIDTGIIPNVTTRVVAKIAFPEVANTALCWGSRSSGTYNTSLDQFYCGHTTTSLWYYSATTQTSIRSGISPNVFYDIDVTNTLVTATATQSIYLFALNNLGTATPNSSSKIAKFEIYDNDVLVRNFIPVKRDYDNVLGMYDTVSGQFFTNQGTGDFIAGPVSANQTLE